MEDRVKHAVSAKQGTNSLDWTESIKIASFLKISVPADASQWTFARHSHQESVEISLVVAGSADFECNHIRYTMQPGDMAVKNAGAVHYERSKAGTSFEQYCLCLSDVAVPDYPENALIPEGVSPLIHTGRTFEFIHATFRYLFDLYNIELFKPANTIRQTLMDIIDLIPSLCVASAIGEADYQQYSELVGSVLKHLDKHYTEPIDLDTIAKSFYVSASYLSHKFKDEVGISIKQYITSRKLGQAQLQLVFDDMPIKEIATSCGYSNLQHFYPAFKKQTGTTPREFRERYQS